MVTRDPGQRPPAHQRDPRTHDAGRVRLCAASPVAMPDGADLIAAAPDLLAALQAMLAGYAHIPDDILDRIAQGTQSAGILTRDACRAILTARRLVRTLGDQP